jgi:ABC-type multidrug transport system ATPase subunit/ABC-type transport system involved in multi-copper enzyme maturation permease subunit
MIRIERLSKSFKGKPALHDLSLEVKQGEVFGLLGHNGAGKSTTFGLILGQLHPTAGEVFVRGISVQKERIKALQGLGAIFETPAFYDYLSGWNNLKIFTSYSVKLSDRELRETVEFVGLSSRIHDSVRVYSHGMRQRLALAQALLPRPEIVLLDEPAEGLDPEGIVELREIILRLNREHGMTVILSSHLLSEVEQMCDRVAILNKGKLIFQGRWNELGLGKAQFRVDVDDWAKAKLVIDQFGASLVDRSTVCLLPEADVADLVSALVRAGVRVRALERARAPKSGADLSKPYLRGMSLFFIQLGHEFKKLFARKRTYIGFGVFLCVEILILLCLNLPRPKEQFRRMIEQNGYGFTDYFSGLTLGLQIIQWMAPILVTLYLSLVAGDVVSKEVEDGTMRMMLCRPISRVRIGIIKYIACVGYTLALLLFIGVTALAAGVLYKGTGGLFVFAPMEKIVALYPMNPGLARYALALPMLALGLNTVTSLGFMFSCCNVKPAAATIVTLSIILFDSIFRNIPYFESLQPYFITTHMFTWLHVFENYIPIWRMAEDYAYLFALDITFVVIGVGIFNQRDFKN